jgi:hypothetical protein
MIVRCKIIPCNDKIQLSCLICAGWWLYSTGVVPKDHQLVEARFLRSLCRGFFELNQQVQLTVGKMLKLVFTFLSVVSLQNKNKNISNKIVWISVRIVWAWFWPQLSCWTVPLTERLFLKLNIATELQNKFIRVSLVYECLYFIVTNWTLSTFLVFLVLFTYLFRCSYVICTVLISTNNFHVAKG